MSGSVVLPFAMLGAFRPQQAASRILGLYTVKSITSNVVLFFIFLGVYEISAETHAAQCRMANNRIRMTLCGSKDHT